MKDWPYVAQEIELKPWDTIFLYTDGLIEAEDAEYNLFGEKRMCEVVRQMQTGKQLNLNLLVANMKQAVDTFVDGAVQNDDLTMLAIQFTKE